MNVIGGNGRRWRGQGRGWAGRLKVTRCHILCVYFRGVCHYKINKIDAGVRAILTL